MKRLDPINENVRYPMVQVIGPNGENLGHMPSRRANELAASYDLDLFCVAPNANPPVCKILNYGKYRFEKEQIEELKQAIEANLVEQLETNNVSKIISDVVRATVKQEVNQLIQTKDFRQKIWERTEQFVNNLIK